jgi:hypothetical protein
MAQTNLKGDDIMGKMEFVDLIVSREKVDELYRAKLARNPVEDTAFSWYQFALANALSAKSLLSQVGVEEAKEITSKEVYDYLYKIGRATGERLGNPTDLDSYIEAYVIEEMSAIPVVPPIEIVERTNTRCVWGVRACQYRDGINKLREENPDYIDDDVVEVLKSRCSHDHGWANGFNPKMHFERVKFMLDGDDGCFFECEVPE